MILLGLVLVLGVAVVAVSVVETGGGAVHLHLRWFTIGTDGTALFIAGAGSVLALLIGLWVLRIGLRRSRRRRREMRELRQRAFEPSSTDPSVRPGQPAPPPAPTPRRSPDADDHFDSAPRD